MEICEETLILQPRKDHTEIFDLYASIFVSIPGYTYICTLYGSTQEKGLNLNQGSYLSVENEIRG